MSHRALQHRATRKHEPWAEYKVDKATTKRKKKIQLTRLLSSVLRRSCSHTYCIYLSALAVRLETRLRSTYIIYHLEVLSQREQIAHSPPGLASAAARRQRPPPAATRLRPKACCPPSPSTCTTAVAPAAAAARGPPGRDSPFRRRRRRLRWRRSSGMGRHSGGGRQRPEREPQNWRRSSAPSTRLRLRTTARQVQCARNRHHGEEKATRVGGRMCEVVGLAAQNFLRLLLAWSWLLMLVHTYMHSQYFINIVPSPASAAR